MSHTSGTCDECAKVGPYIACVTNKDEHLHADRKACVRRLEERLQRSKS